MPKVGNLREFIRKHLKPLVEKDPRLQQGSLTKSKITESTLQCIIADHLYRFVKSSWRVSLDDTIPGIGKRADIVLCKLTSEGADDLKCGVIAIEVKPDGNWAGLQSDLKKLSKYVKILRSPVNFGVLLYLSPQDKHENDLRHLARQSADYKVNVVRIHPRNLR